MTKHEVRNWSEDLAKFAQETSAALPPAGGDFLSCSGGILSFKGSKIPDNELEVVVLDWCHANLYYTGAYVEGQPSPPSCYAFGKDKPALVPHAQSLKAECASCESCEFNKFGSDPRGGKGKACQNTIRLALIPAAALASVEELKKSEVAFFKVPVTSVKHFVNLANSYAQSLKRPPFAMTTIIKGDAGAKKEPVSFLPGEKIEDGDILAAIMEKRGGITIDFPFQAAEDNPVQTKPAATPNRNRFGRK